MFNASRLVVLLSAGLAFTAFVQPASAQSRMIKVGEKVEGELKGDRKEVRIPGGVWSFHAAEFTIDLKEGQTIVISATVVGKTRGVGLCLVNPSGVQLACIPAANENPALARKTVELKYEELSATGRYKIHVVSELVGGFTVRVTDPAAASDEKDIKALETRIETLEKELAEARAKLKKLKDTTRAR
jgi:hypothetical protein